MLIFLRRIIVWISRICHCRGFGVQSPNDYAFVRYVINEHYPYYAYSDLKKKYPDIDRECRRVCEFYLRIANHLQPAAIANFHEEPCFESYLRAGCAAAEILCGTEMFRATTSESAAVDESVKERHAGARDNAGDDVIIGQRRLDLAILPLGGKHKSYFAPLCGEVMNHMTEKSALILHGIHSNRETMDFWRMIQSDDRVGITFDLYYLGVVFFDTKRYKHDYIVNF